MRMVRPRRGEMKKKPKYSKKKIIPSTTFNDLNIQCIEHILKQLELSDLMSVADTSLKLRSIAQVVFSIKYKGDMFDIYIIWKTNSPERK